MTRRFLISLATATSLGGLALAGAPQLVTRRAWEPLVRLTRATDPLTALPRLRAAADTLGAVFTGLEIDAPASEVLGELRGELEAFDLEEFHALLPDADGPAWRRLHLVGARDGRAYRVRRAAPHDAHTVSPGAAVGDLALELRARQVAASDGEQHYLVRGRAEVGVGTLGWDELAAGLRAGAVVAGSGDPCAPHHPRDMDQRAAPSTRLAVLEAHPTLRSEDLEVVALVWEAFPNLGRTLLDVGRIEDVVVFDPKSDGAAQQLRLMARLRPDLLEARYPHLAEFLRGLGPLAHVQIALRDARGRQLARFGLETLDLRLRLEAFVSPAGDLLPIDGGRPVLGGEPIDLSACTATVDVRSLFNGLEARLQGMKVRCSFSRDAAGGGDLVAAITEVPQVTMKGSAFGVLPTWAIDAVIPGDLDTLTRDFLRAACAGNEGRGIEVAVRSRRDGDQAALRLEGGLEVLDSTLISFAMQIVSLKLLPSAEERSDLFALLASLQQAFVSDLNRYELLAR